MWLCCPPAITRTSWLFETWRRRSTLRWKRRQQPTRSSTSAPPAAASTPSPLQRLVGLQHCTHTDTLNYPHVVFSKLILFPLTAKESTYKNVLPLPVSLRRQSRFDVESLETSTESRELRLPSEESAHWRPLFSRWPEWNRSEFNMTLSLLSNAQN